MTVSGVMKDYYFNYQNLGIDILFDGERHTVKAIVLHTNVPGHSDFGSYRKCNFSVATKTAAVFPEASAQAVDDTLSFSGDDTLETIRRRFQQDHPLTGPNSIAESSQSPFGGVQWYGNELLSIEVTATHLVNTVTLFRSL